MAKGSGPGPDDIMAASAMKPLLALSKREPVNAALGLTADKLGVLLLHKKTKPRKLLAQLRADAKKIQLNLESPSLRFGTAEVDPEIDSALVRFRVNKEAPGMLGAKLREHLKKAGFSKVEFVVDPSLEDEAEETETAPTEAQPAPAEPDWGALMTELTALAKQIAGVGDPQRQPSLVQLAMAANAAIKARQDFAATTAAVAALREALGSGGGRAGGKAVPMWQQAKDAVDDQLRTLSDRLRNTAVPELAEVADEVETLLAPLRTKLVGALLEYDKDPAKPEFRTAALSAVQTASEWLGSDGRVRAVDDNRFGVTVSAGVTLGAALRQLQRELETV